MLDTAIERDESGDGVGRPDQYWAELSGSSTITPADGRGPIAMVVWWSEWDGDTEQRSVGPITFYGDCGSECRTNAEAAITVRVLADDATGIEHGACGNCEAWSVVSFFELDEESATALERSELAAVMAPIDTQFEAGLLLGSVHTIEARGDGWRIVTAAQQDPYCHPITTTYEVWDVTESGATELLDERTVERDPKGCD